MTEGRPPAPEQDLTLGERIHLVELVDRVLDKGVVLRGDVMISVAGVDLLYLELRLLLSSVETLRERGVEPPR
ncbi:MAG TPA: gas vesicle protein [Longimicrobiales bacterium]|nr:gas vesicle protein [Longimicrobiales bacterium]